MIFLRDLAEQDAYVSANWRNDPEIWKYTGKRPDQVITVDMEIEWIRDVLTRRDQKRFAICLVSSGRYIGNVQLTDITKEDAQFHIFIGDRTCHGKGIGTLATKKLIRYAFDQLKLDSVYLYVKKDNVAAVKAYEKVGFSLAEDLDETLKMEIFVNGQAFT